MSAPSSPYPHRRLFRQTAKDCGAVDRARALVRNSQPSAEKISARAKTHPSAATPPTRRRRHLRLKVAPPIGELMDLGSNVQATQRGALCFGVKVLRRFAPAPLSLDRISSCL